MAPEMKIECVRLALASDAAPVELEVIPRIE
jgi:hypothetical protein